MVTLFDPPLTNVYDADCPTRRVLDRIADKWTALIIGLLESEPKRFSQLQRGIGGISQKMLAQTLRSLERDGLVVGLDQAREERRDPLAVAGGLAHGRRGRPEPPDPPAVPPGPHPVPASAGAAVGGGAGP